MSRRLIRVGGQYVELPWSASESQGQFGLSFTVLVIVLGGEQTAVSGQRFRGNPLGDAGAIGQPLLQPISAFAGQLPRASPSFRGLLQCGQVMHLHCCRFQGLKSKGGPSAGRCLAESAR